MLQEIHYTLYDHNSLQFRLTRIITIIRRYQVPDILLPANPSSFQTNAATVNPGTNRPQTQISDCWGTEKAHGGSRR